MDGLAWLFYKLNVDWASKDSDFIPTTEFLMTQDYTILLAEGSVYEKKHQHSYYFLRKQILPYKQKILSLYNDMPHDIFQKLFDHTIQLFALNVVRQDVDLHIALMHYGHALLASYDPTEKPLQIVIVKGNGLLGPLMRNHVHFIYKKELEDLIHDSDKTKF